MFNIDEDDVTTQRTLFLICTGAGLHRLGATSYLHYIYITFTY